MTQDNDHCVLILADRRTLRWAQVADEVRELAQTLTGLNIEMMPDFDTAPDAGAFRDFAPVARASAHDRRIVDAMVEELLLEFGFAVDFKPQ